MMNCRKSDSDYNEAFEWVIAICCTDASGVRLSRFFGTADLVKQKLVNLVHEDKGNDDDNAWCFGTNDIDNIEVIGDGCLYAYGVYFNYHIDYTAKRIDKLRYE